MAHRAVSSINSLQADKAGRGAVIGRTFASLGNPSYRAFWISLLASYSAMQMNIVARGYLAYVLTGSATALGLVSLARGFSMLMLSPFAGVIADHVDKRKLLVATQSGLMIIALTASALVHFQIIKFWHLIILGLLEGAIFTFNAPTRQSILPQLVDDHTLSNAIALNASGRNLTRIVAPSLAGIILGISVLGISGAFDCIALAYCVAAILLLRLRTIRPAETASQASRKSVRITDMLSGFRYILHSPRLRLLIVLGFVPVLLGNPYQTLLPVFQARVLNVGPTELGILYGAAGIGGLLGTLVVAAIADDPRKATFQLGFGILYAVALMLFALIHVLSIDLVFLAIVGVAGDGYSTLNSTLVMLNTDRAWYGRVMSIYMMNWSLMPLATLPLGVLADVIGAPFTEAIAGSLILAVVGGVTLFYPAWRKMGETTPATA